MLLMKSLPSLFWKLKFRGFYRAGTNAVPIFCEYFWLASMMSLISMADPPLWCPVWRAVLPKTSSATDLLFERLDERATDLLRTSFVRPLRTPS